MNNYLRSFKKPSGPIVVFGSTGQVGRALMQRLGKSAVGFSREQVDFSDPYNVDKALSDLEYVPKAILNAAAYTDVEKAEEEENVAHVVNGDSVSVLARYTYVRDIPLIYYSSDYVFPGTGEEPWREEDPVDPINAYGRSKVNGEHTILSRGDQYIILRASWVYDAYGKNFVNTMLRLAKERSTLQVVEDQVGAPTYAPAIAQGTVELLDRLENRDKNRMFPSGIYHMCNGGEVSWYDFARKIFAQASAMGMDLAIKEVEPISSRDYPTKAPRPRNSRLNCNRLAEDFGVTLPHWEESLKECLTLMTKGA